MFSLIMLNERVGFAFGAVSVAGDGVSVRRFLKNFPSSNSAPSLAKAESISTSVINIFQRGNRFGKGFCFGGALSFWRDVGLRERQSCGYPGE